MLARKSYARSPTLLELTDTRFDTQWKKCPFHLEVQTDALIAELGSFLTLQH